MMSLRAKEEYLRAVHGRYRQATRAAKGQILDEFCASTGYHRKSALRLLHGPPPGRARPRRRHRAATYGTPVIQALTTIWEAAGYPWSVRLKALLPLWLPWARRRLRLSATVCRQLRAISSRQIDRRLALAKRTLKTRRYGRTKPGTLLKHHIPLKTDHWDVTVPGFTELDLVAHAGDRADGEFAHSLNVTDIHTTWGETRAVLGRGEHRVQAALDEIRQALPFRLQGIDSDNGSEFINDHLYRYCQAHAIQFTRGRPYKKDDNAHIEQKNWTHVRKLVGYLRYDTPAAVTALNALYRHELRFFQNLFLPSVKLVRKERVGARLRRRYDAPRTPLDRLQTCPAADPATVASWVALRDQLDPFALSQAIDRKIERLVTLATTPRTRLTPAAGPTAGAAASPIVRRRRPPPPRHLKTPFTFGNRLRRPLGQPSRVTS
jgi:hypothetical protein